MLSKVEFLAEAVEESVRPIRDALNIQGDVQARHAQRMIELDAAVQRIQESITNPEFINTAGIGSSNRQAELPLSASHQYPALGDSHRNPNFNQSVRTFAGAAGDRLLNLTRSNRGNKRTRELPSPPPHSLPLLLLLFLVIVCKSYPKPTSRVVSMGFRGMGKAEVFSIVIGYP